MHRRAKELSRKEAVTQPQRMRERPEKKESAFGNFAVAGVFLTSSVYPLALPLPAPLDSTAKPRRKLLMKRFLIFLAAFSFALSLFGQEKAPQLKDQKDRVRYSIGLNIGSNLGRQNVQINPDALAAGIKDAIAGKPQLTQDQVKETMAAFEKDMMEKQKAAADKNASEGAKFLEENKKKAGVKTTASGLQYKVIKEGTGAQPKENETVTVNYRGTLINGTEFDSSYKRGEAATFPVDGVIKGWTEALQLMKVGSKYQLFVPANLAYGERAVGPDISPNSTLIFEVELMGIKPSGSGASPAPTASPR